MAYFAVCVTTQDGKEHSFDFQSQEFGVAQGAFQALCLCPRVDECDLYIIGGEMPGVVITTKREFLEALEKQGMRPVNKPHIMRPGL